MKKLITFLTGIMAFVPLVKSDNMNTQDSLIDDKLQVRFVFPAHWLKAEVDSAQIIKESDAGWLQYMHLFSENLKKNGLDGREDLIEGKKRIRDMWIRQRKVLLEHLAAPDTAAYRFDGGQDEPCGYIVLKSGKPFRILTFRINRPDPSVGNVHLPFP